MAAEGDHVATVGSNRKLLIFPLDQLPVMGRGKGVLLQRYKGGELADAAVLRLADGLSWPTAKGTRTRDRPLTLARPPRPGRAHRATRLSEEQSIRRLSEIRFAISSPFGIDPADH